jgi:hypothetical protein
MTGRTRRSIRKSGSIPSPRSGTGIIIHGILAETEKPRAAIERYRQATAKRDRMRSELSDQKDSAVYSYTWIDGFGQHYETNDRNDNPNGRLKGNWNQQNVH